MTQKDFYRAVAENNITESVIEYAAYWVKKNEERSAAEETVRNEFRANLLAVLEENAPNKMTAAEIGNALDVTAQKASAHLMRMAGADLIRREQTKSENGGHKIWVYYVEK